MLSTPLICCSSGVATDCSIVTASAPVYVVVTIICGGTMSGNWATGSPAMATSPPMTVTMAITIATIGRLMKNFEIIVQSLTDGFRILKLFGAPLIPALQLSLELPVHYYYWSNLLCSLNDD